MSCYFLTGGTGVVGSRVLEHLLEDSANRVYVLVRADSDERASERVRSLLRSSPSREAIGASERIVALRGDATRPRFGLLSHAYQQLVADCRRIVHSAGLVRMNLPIEEARTSAVGAAEEILALARDVHEKGRLEKVEFVSTVGVGGRTSDVREQWIDEPRGFHNTYEQAKAEAETRIRAAVIAGLPITVHRPSMVVGDAQTGRITSFQVFYHLCEFLSGLRSRGLLPAFDRARLDTIPVDYVARAVIWSSRAPDLCGKVMHECSGAADSMAIEELQDLVRTKYREHGIQLPRTRNISQGLFRAILRPLGAIAPATTRRAIATAPVFLDYLASEQHFHNEKTRSLLGSEIPLPSARSYLPGVLEYYLQQRKMARK